jgi:selenocysteine-specific elongation factor
LVKINNDFYIHADVDREIREKLRPLLADQGLTVSQIRELLGTSRKYALPLCEHFDKVGFTRRVGDVRYLGG